MERENCVTQVHACGEELMVVRIFRDQQRWECTARRFTKAGEGAYQFSAAPGGKLFAINDVIYDGDSGESRFVFEGASLILFVTDDYVLLQIKDVGSVVHLPSGEMDRHFVGVVAAAPLAWPGSILIDLEDEQFWLVCIAPHNHWYLQNVDVSDLPYVLFDGKWYDLRKPGNVVPLEECPPPFLKVDFQYVKQLSIQSGDRPPTIIPGPFFKSLFPSTYRRINHRFSVVEIDHGIDYLYKQLYVVDEEAQTYKSIERVLTYHFSPLCLVYVKENNLTGKVVCV